MKFNEFISEGGFLTEKGKKYMEKTFQPVFYNLLGDLDTKFSLAELTLLESVLKKEIADFFINEKQKSIFDVEGRMIQGAQLPEGGFIKLGQ